MARPRPFADGLLMGSDTLLHFTAYALVGSRPTLHARRMTFEEADRVDPATTFSYAFPVTCLGNEGVYRASLVDETLDYIVCGGIGVRVAAWARACRECAGATGRGTRAKDVIFYMSRLGMMPLRLAKLREHAAQMAPIFDELKYNERRAKNRLNHEKRRKTR